VNLLAAAIYDPEPTAVAAARRFVRETLRSWDVLSGDDLVADAELLTSELVTDAVMNAGTPVRVTCRADASEVEVSVLKRQPARTVTGPYRNGDSGQFTGQRLLPAMPSSSWWVTFAPEARAAWIRLVPDGDAQASSVADTGAAALAAHIPGRPGSTSLAQAAGTDSALQRLSYQELLSHTVEAACDAAAADAAYVLIADEDGALRMRAAVGLGAPQEEPRMPEQPTTRPQSGRTGIGMFLAACDSLPESCPDGMRASAEPPRSFLTAPIRSEDNIAGVIAVMAAEADRFTAEDLARVRNIADQVAMPLDRARLNEHDRARRGRITFLSEASQLLAGTLDQDQTIALAAQLFVPQLAEWCAVLLADQSGQPRVACVWHADEDRRDALNHLLSRVPPPRHEALVENGLRWPLAMTSGEFLPPDAAEIAAGQAWSFPLLARGRSLGLLAIGRPDSRPLSSQAAEMAQDLTQRVALALDNARLYSERARASHELQRSLLPPQLPVIPGLDVAAGYQAAGDGNEVGGDFYDVFKVGPDRWRFAVGDVCGKGLKGAAVTGLARHALRILAREGHDIPAVLERLNSIILDEGSDVPFITLIHGEIVVRPSRVALSIVCAGHPPPLLLRSLDGGVRRAAGSQSLIGVMDRVTFRSDTCHIGPGDMLLCVTDGVTERRAGDRLLDDDNGLRQLFGRCSGLNAGAVVARIQREVSEFGSSPPADDMALVVFRGN
jgi:serine phosphatase RsbU (regulator of sigma subunit)